MARPLFIQISKLRQWIMHQQRMGGKRGYGPTHSQVLEKLFLGVES